MDNLTPYDKYASGDYLLHNIRIFLHAGAKVAIFPETAKHFPDCLCFFLNTESRSDRVFYLRIFLKLKKYLRISVPLCSITNYTLCSVLFILSIRSGTLLRTASTTRRNWLSRTNDLVVSATTWRVGIGKAKGRTNWR